MVLGLRKLFPEMYWTYKFEVLPNLLASNDINNFVICLTHKTSSEVTF